MSRKSAAPYAVAAFMAAMLASAASAQTAAAPPAPVQAEEPVPIAPPADAIIASVDKISPLQLVHVISEFWQRGDKLQAALWFYVWQIRTDPWMGTDPSFDETRNILNNNMGQAINGWIAADPELWLATARRAVTFETKLPMWDKYPPEMTQEEWNARIANLRASYEKEMEDAFIEVNADAIRKNRTENGLYVGPLNDAGAPLPDAWR